MIMPPPPTTRASPALSAKITIGPPEMALRLMSGMGTANTSLQYPYVWSGQTAVIAPANRLEKNGPPFLSGDVSCVIVVVLFEWSE
jgi:hypothetical protein